MSHSEGNLLSAILHSVGRHPNSKVSKLVKTVEEERTHKNIVMLLMEIAEHQEYCSDFGISLIYYLNLFENLKSKDIILNEFGLMLINSSRIYARRVDSVFNMVDCLICSLRNSESELNKAKNQTVTIATNQEQEQKKELKRKLELPKSPCEAEAPLKKLRFSKPEKRFAQIGQIHKNKDIEKSCASMRTEKCPYSPLWVLTNIIGMEDEEEADSKKDFRIFIYCLLLRYYNLAHDLHFILYFKIKDYVAEIEDRIQECELNGEKPPERLPWPPQSEEDYIKLEKKVVEIEQEKLLYKLTGKTSNGDNGECYSLKAKDSTELFRQYCYQTSEESTQIDSALGNSLFDLGTNSMENGLSDMNKTIDDIHNSSSTQKNDSGLGNSLLESTNPIPNETNNATIDDIRNDTTCQEDSAIDESWEISNNIDSSFENQLTETTNILNEDNEDPSCQRQEKGHTTDELHLDLVGVKVHLPHLDDEGVFFSELDEQDQKMLSPAVVATDVFQCITHKRNLSVIIDDDIRALYDIQDPPEISKLPLPVVRQNETPKMILNILKINLKYLRRSIIFKLGPEFELFIKDRQRKRKLPIEVNEVKQKWYRLSDEDMTGVPTSPVNSRESSVDFYGFPDDSQEKNRTLSSDSGIELPTIEGISDKPVLDTNAQNDCTNFDSTINIVSEQNITSKLENLLAGDISNQANNTVEEQTVTQPAIADVCSNITLKTKIQRWHEHLQPILAKSKQRHHFDVFEIGSEIVHQIQNDGGNMKSVSFQDVMDNKDSSFVSRYFLSTLLLANQNNINIMVQNLNSEKPSEWSDVQLQLLSTHRHSISMEDNIGLIVSKKRAADASTHEKDRRVSHMAKLPKVDYHDSGLCSEKLGPQ